MSKRQSCVVANIGEKYFNYDGRRFHLLLPLGRPAATTREDPILYDSSSDDNTTDTGRAGSRGDDWVAGRLSGKGKKEDIRIFKWRS